MMASRRFAVNSCNRPIERLDMLREARGNPHRSAREGAGMISFVIPAHNEAELIGRTLSALHESARAAGEKYEVIVVDDSSIDRTGAIARENGARVVAVNFRQIAATRNAGARVATGDLLFFVDADTMVTGRAVRAAVQTMRGGAVGGGSAVRFDGPVPLYATILERLVLPVLLPLLKLAPGCFLFCTQRAFLAAGGFDETLFWSEEVAFGKRLKRQGRFVILRESVITSGRKVRANSALGMLRVGVRLALGQRRALDYWYGPRVRMASTAAEPSAADGGA
jgi:cellulose synthase/poly-beta-1,6-N-acetylglucosamine synthase-like glycosyltransferase